MSTWDASNLEGPSHQDAISAERRAILAQALQKMENSLQRLRDVEAQATPMTKLLLSRHIRTIEEKLSRAEADFLRAESATVVRQAYQIMAACQKQQEQEGLSD
jgi:hypothetical protein